MSIQSIRQTITEIGRRNALYYFLGRFLQKISCNHARILRYYFVAQPVPATPPTPSRPSASSSVRQITPSDPIVPRFPRPAAVLAQRFENGDICFVAEQKTRFAGFIWFARQAYEEDEVRCRYVLTDAQRSVWDYDIYIEPEFRIGRTFSRLWETANQTLSAQGVRWSISRISAFNTTSLAVHSRLGIRTLGTGTFIVLGGIQISLFNHTPFIHISFRKRHRPVLSFAPPED